MSDSASLLADLRDLRHRARQDRHGYAFSLLLFGALILAAPLLYTPAEQVDPFDGFDPKVTGDNTLVRVFRTMAGPDPAHPTLIAVYWLAVLVVGFGATAWWYRRRAARIGIETDTRALLVTAVAAFAGFFLGTYLFSPHAVTLYGAWQINVSIIVVSPAVGALVLWRTRHPIAVFAASVCGAVGFSAIAVYTNKGFSALLVIAGGLLALAWLERSTLLGWVSVLFTLAAIPSTAMIITPSVTLDPGYLFYELGWQISWPDPRTYALWQLLIPAAVLLVGGTVAAIRYRR